LTICALLDYFLVSPWWMALFAYPFLMGRLQKLNNSQVDIFDQMYYEKDKDSTLLKLAPRHSA
jgi:hypothetical protein